MAGEKITTAEEALAAVRRDGLLLEYVPKEFKNAELCLEALWRDGSALQYVPENLKTAELCLEACKAKIGANDGFDDRVSALEYVPDGLKTPEVCMAAIRQCEFAHRYIPKTFWNAQTCMEAARLNGWILLQVVPENLRTAELYMEAVRSNGYALRFVPKNLRTAGLCMEAMKRDGFSLADIPEEFMTAQICLDAVRRDDYEFAYLPEKFKTPEICREAVARRARALRLVPDGLKTPEICAAAMRGDAGMFRFVPDHLKTPQMCMEAVRHHGRLLWYVPPEFRTAQLCMEAVKSHSEAFRQVPENLRTMELCLEAARRYYKLELLPPEFVGEIKKRVFLLKDIVKLDDASVAKAFQSLELDSLETAKALVLLDGAGREKAFKNMPKKEAAMLAEDMEYMGPIRMKDAEAAAIKVCEVFLEMERKGEIVLPHGGGDETATPEPGSTTLGAAIKAELGKSLLAAKDAETASRIESCLNLLDEKLPALLSRGYAAVGGVEYVNEVFNLAENVGEIYELLIYENPELFEDYQRSMAEFDDFVLMSDRDTQKIIREADSDDFVKALYGAGEEVREKIFKNMSRRGAEMLKEDMERAGPIALDAALEARKRILAIFTNMAEIGEVGAAGYGYEPLVV